MLINALPLNYSNPGAFLYLAGQCEKVFSEKMSRTSRKALTACKEFIWKGDILTFTKIDWLECDAKLLHNLVAKLEGYQHQITGSGHRLHYTVG